MWYSTLSTQSRLLSILHSSVHWACFTLNYPIGRLGPAPANGHLLASFRRSVDTKILLFAKSKNAIQASHIWAPLLPLPRKPLFLSVSLRGTAFTISENSIAIASCITFEMDLPRESSPQEHYQLKRASAASLMTEVATNNSGPPSVWWLGNGVARIFGGTSIHSTKIFLMKRLERPDVGLRVRLRPRYFHQHHLDPRLSLLGIRAVKDALILRIAIIHGRPERST